MFVSRYMPCDECGESLDRTAATAHQCNPERLAEFQMFALRDRIADLDASFRSYLRTRHGRFEAWLAARQVRQRW